MIEMFCCFGLITGVIFGVVFIISSIAGWCTHLLQNNGELKIGETKYFITYWQFKKLFKKYESNFYITPIWPTSLFGKGDDYENFFIHASIIRINGKLYYIITPIQWALTELFIWKYARGNRKYKYSFFKV